jgi:hypothetical protein
MKLVGKDKLSFVLRDVTDDLAGTVTLSPLGQTQNEIIGKNGNSIIYSLKSGTHCRIEIPVLKGSSFDSLLGLYYTYSTFLKVYTPIFGTLRRFVGDGKGNIREDQYYMSGLIFVQEPNYTVLSSDGDVEQAITRYVLQGLVER